LADQQLALLLLILQTKETVAIGSHVLYSWKTAADNQTS